MRETWRWFGPDDPVSLSHVRQAGAAGVVTALHHIYGARRWSADEVADRKAMVEAAGLTWDVCESIPVSNAIKRRNGDWQGDIDAWKDTLANLGRAGVPVVCYNFMPVVDWTRTALRWPMPCGALALRFDLADFAAYDVFVLKRPGAEADYSDALLTVAHDRLAKMDDARIATLEQTIIAGLPGGEDSHDRAGIATLIETYAGLSPEDLRANLIAFLREVVPVAEEFGMRLAIHPDDPPRPLFGLPRVVSTAADAAAILATIESPANGLCLCAGSYGSHPANDVVAMARAHAGRIAFVHLRNVSKGASGGFTEAAHLDGDVDMVALIRVLRAEERQRQAQGAPQPQIPMRPDHGHLIGPDSEGATNPGYPYIGRLRGLAELRGVIRAVDAMEAA